MFGAAIFLTGLLAVGVPVAIHLLARQRTRVLPWGAMPFLHESISSASSKRNRLKDLLLLLLRAIAILFLVLTFAQPLVSRLLFGGSDLETVFVWDISLSTTAQDEKGKPLFESLKESLLEELADLPARSQVRVLLAGSELRWLKDEPLVLSSANRGLLEAAIRKQRADQGGSELATAILTAMAAEDAESPKTRNIVVLHDGRREGWQADDSNRWQSIRQRLAGTRSLSLRIVEPPAEIAAALPQLSVASLEPDRDTAALNSPMRFRATLKNHSEAADLETTVIWKIDGREVERSIDVRVPAGEELKLEQFLQFEESGGHRVSCVAELRGDVMPADNTLTTAISVPDGIPVLIVDDTVRNQPGQILPSEFLSASLGSLVKIDAKKSDKKTADVRKSIFIPRVVKSRELNASTMDGNLGVLIANAESLPESTLSELRSFVEGGGGLWLIMGSDWEEMPEWSSRLLKELGLEPLSKTRRTVAKDSEHLMKIVPSDPSGSFAIGMAADRLDLHRAELLAVHTLEQRAYLVEEKLMETEEGGPVLLSLAVGAGRVMLQTTDLDRTNTNLPVLQSFVPLMREGMMEAIKGALPRRNLNPGEPIRLPLSGGTNSDDQRRIMRPDDSLRETRFQGHWHELAETLNPGIYQLEQPDSGDSRETTEFFSVRRPAAESELEPVPAATIAALVESPSDLPAAAARELRLGRWPLAWLFAILTGLFFLAETLLAHWISHRREATSVGIDLKPVF